MRSQPSGRPPPRGPCRESFPYLDNDIVPEEGSEGSLKRSLTAPTSCCSNRASRRRLSSHRTAPDLPGGHRASHTGGFGCLSRHRYAEFRLLSPLRLAYTYGRDRGEFIVDHRLGTVLRYIFAARPWRRRSGTHAFFTSLGSHPGRPRRLAFTGRWTHTLVRAQLCVDPATGGMVDAVSPRDTWPTASGRGTIESGT